MGVLIFAARTGAGMGAFDLGSFRVDVPGAAVEGTTAKRASEAVAHLRPGSAAANVAAGVRRAVDGGFADARIDVRTADGRPVCVIPAAELPMPGALNGQPRPFWLRNASVVHESPGRPVDVGNLLDPE